MNLEPEQEKQEDQYQFPYHHLVTMNNGDFSLSRQLFWGYEYLSYIHFVISLIKKTDGRDILDVGCGDGKFIYEMVKETQDKDIHGVDYSEKAVSLAQYFNPTAKLKIANIMSENPYSSHFDVVTLIEVLEHIPTKEVGHFISKIYSLLKYEGMFVVTVPSKNMEKNPKHYQHFDRRSLQNALQPHFKIKDTYYLNTQSFFQKIIERLFSNRIFILNNHFLRNVLYRTYCKWFLFSKPEKCGRICVIAQPTKAR